MGNKANKELTDESKFDLLFKIVFAGDLGVGKSSLILQFVEKTWTGGEVATIGAEFRIKMLEIEKKKVKLQIWDTAGQEKFRAITVSYYRGSSAVIVVFDLTNRESFVNVEKWVCESKTMTNKPNTAYLIVGNKTDLKKREVTEKEVQALVEKCTDANTPVFYAETSAKTGAGVDDAFKKLSDALVKEGL